MYFLLKSEVETIDTQKNYYKKRVFCPFCFKAQLKKLESNDLYIKYHCWNKNCGKRENPFIVLKDYIQDEDKFEDICETCQEPLRRELKSDENQNILLIFKCKSKLCETNIDPYCYNISNHEWEGNPPRVIVYDNMLDANKFDIEANEESIKKTEIEKEKIIDSFSIVSQEQENQEVFYKIEETPLLTMNSVEYSKFLEHQQNKVVCLVDVPNFIRTLRAIFPRNFEDVLKKAHKLLIEYIENSFHISNDYIIRYFSKPDKDLDIPNNIIINFCAHNPNKEIFHLLKVLKGAGYSDIDNYLIANGVEILERCEIKGFLIVSSDKDYLPVMRIASYKNIKSRILGINTPEIYEKYNIEDVKFLGIMRFFEN